MLLPARHIPVSVVPAFTIMPRLLVVGVTRIPDDIRVGIAAAAVVVLTAAAPTLLSVTNGGGFTCIRGIFSTPPAILPSIIATIPSSANFVSLTSVILNLFSGQNA
jgi:hypothetical protein